jgi:thiaminase/transcriptional activator TenA
MRVSERFTDRLREKAEDIMVAQHSHPFVTGIGDGTLDIEKFKIWVRQDYLYLIEFARLFSLASARSPGLAEMTHFASLADFTLKNEMELHRSYAREFGITEKELEQEEKYPICQAYTDFLVRTTSLGSFGEFACVFLPCVWGYTEIGLRLADKGLPSDGRYANWIEMYSSKEQIELNDHARELVDSAALEQPDSELARMERAYITSARYEFLFWEMCWSGQNWPV